MTDKRVNSKTSPPSWPDFHTSPGHLLRRARQYHDAVWGRLVPEGLTPVQAAVLTALITEPGLDQRTLGQRVAVDKSTIGDLLARLARRGDIVQLVDAEDSRRRIPTVTRQGVQTLRAAAPLIEMVGTSLLAPLEPAERQELVRLLDKLVFNADVDSVLDS